MFGSGEVFREEEPAGVECKLYVFGEVIDMVVFVFDKRERHFVNDAPVADELRPGGFLSNVAIESNCVYEFAGEFYCKNFVEEVVGVGEGTAYSISNVVQIGFRRIGKSSNGSSIAFPLFGEVWIAVENSADVFREGIVFAVLVACEEETFRGNRVLHVVSLPVGLGEGIDEGAQFPDCLSGVALGPEGSVIFPGFIDVKDKCFGKEFFFSLDTELVHSRLNDNIISEDEES